MMQVTANATGRVLGTAGVQVLGNNIEAYENTIPSMLSDRLRNPKFAGPANPQTGLAPEWEPVGNAMRGFACQLVPGMYLSGREAQLIHNFAEKGTVGIVQAGVAVRSDESYDVEVWARAHHRPVTLRVELRLPGQRHPDSAQAELSVDQAHWHRRTCRIVSPGNGGAFFQINVPGDSRVVIDQIHLRPVGQTHVSPELLDAFGAFPCPVLRFPGGCVSCAYHWQHGTGPVHLRPVDDDPVFKMKVHYDFGTDEFLELCAAKNIRPLITLNTTTATPEDAADWAGYVRAWYVRRGLPVPAAYFMFGNENYGTWEIGHMTGAMYAAQLRAFVPGVRAAYPEAKMLAIGEFESGGLREAYKSPWRSVVIEQAADLFDSLVVTSYAWGSDSDSLAEGMHHLADRVTDKATHLARQAQSIRDAGLACTMGIMEWNYWTRASHNDQAGFYEPNDIRHCLYAAGYLNAFCRLGEILELANFYSLVNTMGMIHVRDGQVTLSDLVKVFNLYADALPGEVLEVTTDAPMLTSISKIVDVNLMRKGDTVYGFLINYSASETVPVKWKGVGIVKEALGLRAEAILTPVTAFVPGCHDNVITLPPMSLVRVCCA